jgi:phospholipase C
LLDMGLDYRVYFQDVPSVLQHKDMRRKEARERYRLLDVLYSDLAAGTMPEFSWVEPAYFSTKKQPATDQHPDHDVGLGEQLIKDIYESVRSSPIWNETAFIVTYDEHGGFFDHVAPPVNVPNPDGLNATDDPFDFTRLGIRVPTVVISPWVKKGTIIHAPHDTTASQYDHTSLISTVVHKLFGPNEGFHIQPYLTDRDAWSKTFEWVFTTVESPRTDCPMELPSIYSQAAYVPPQDGTMLLTDLQQELIQIVAGAANDLNEHKNVNSWTEEQAATYIHDRMVELGILV